MNTRGVKFLLPFAAVLLFSEGSAMKLQWSGGLNGSSNAVEIATKVSQGYAGLPQGQRTEYRGNLTSLLNALYSQSGKKLNDVMKSVIEGGMTFTNTRLAAVLKKRKDALSLLLDIANAGFTKVDDWSTLVASEGKSPETTKFWKNFADKYNGEGKDSLNAALNRQADQQKQQAQATIRGANAEYITLERKVSVYSAENKPTQEQRNALIGEIDAQIAALTDAQRILGDNNAKTAIDQLNTLKENFNGFGIKEAAGGGKPENNTLQKKLKNGVEVWTEGENLKAEDKYLYINRDGKDYTIIDREGKRFVAPKILDANGAEEDMFMTENEFFE